MRFFGGEVNSIRVLLKWSLIVCCLIRGCVSIPFVVVHGIGDECSSNKVDGFTQELKNLSKSEGFCLEIGNGFMDSWFKPLQEQVEIACTKVKQIKELQDGYNIVGLSQGNLIGRGVVEFCEGGPPVRNFVSLGGPHAGIASLPLCGSGAFCAIVDKLIKSGTYSKYAQAHLAPSGYVKLPNNIGGYLSNCEFLPILNNEVPHKKNVIYKRRFSNLQNLVLIMFEDDIVLVPKETSWFGFYPDDKFGPILPPNQTRLYTEDWIGLKTLDDERKVKYIRVSGKHIEISTDDMIKYVVPYVV
ncbi:uncharacterized protein LOC127241791 [Andrographis paniculata]|uniref:uncharacterized protein LOC127241791 n=1 Tax=Andrographis paniculata TaxID=175694 RepID=UPI0021E75B59|nr:uncharacterized protein LOC127241791 [Andrographis paniculata]